MAMIWVDREPEVGVDVIPPIVVEVAPGVETRVVVDPAVVPGPLLDEVEAEVEVEVKVVVLILFKQVRSGRTWMAPFNRWKVENVLQLSLRQTASIW